MEKNGRGSSGKRTRHINIRYYFVTDRINADELSVEYCPTEMMLADFYSKPLQGKMFRLFRSILLNLDDPDMKDYCIKSDVTIKKSSVTSQECVEENDKNESNNIAPNNKKSDVENDQITSKYDGIKKQTIGLYNCTRGIIGRSRPTILRNLKRLGTVHLNKRKQ